MTVADATLRILEAIQGSIADLGRKIEENGRKIEENGRKIDANGRRLDHHDLRLHALERHAAAANEILGLMNERLLFFERAATAATQGRARLEDRVERNEQVLYRVDARVGELEARDED